MNFLENKYFESVHVQDPTKSQKLEKFRSWLLQQYNLVKNELYNLCLSDSVDIQVPAIRTIIEVGELNLDYLLSFLVCSM